MDTETVEATEIEEAIAAEMGEDEPEIENDGETEPEAPFNETNEACEICGCEPGTQHIAGPHIEAMEQAEAEPPPVDEAAIEKVLKALQKENERHATAVERIMADDFATVIPCELCSPVAAGFRWPEALGEQQIAAVRNAIGLPDLTTFRKTEGRWTCDTCAGLGRVLTGSSVVGQETIRCHTCNGSGFQSAGALGGATPAPADDAAPLVPLDGSGESAPDLDPWGRNPTHPGYFKMPHVGMPEHELPDNWGGA